MSLGPAREARQEIAFTVQTIDCIACSPFFRRALMKIGGVVEVKELPITNKIIVVFDGTRLERSALEQEIIRVSKSAGYGGKVIIRR